jgi:transketolase
METDGTPTRVVSLLSWHLFSTQDEEYRRRVLPPEVRVRVSIEAGGTMGWHRWIGSEGRAIGIEHFGASAPAGTLFMEFGLTPEAVVDEAKRLLS